MKNYMTPEEHARLPRRRARQALGLLVAVLVLIGLKLAVELGYWSMSDGETPPQGNARERWRALTEQR